MLHGWVNKIALVIVFGSFIAACSSTRHYYVQRAHMEKAKAEMGEKAIPAITPNGKHVAIWANQVRWKAGEKTRCLHDLDKRITSSSCFQVDRVSYTATDWDKTADALTYSGLGLLLIGVALIVYGVSQECTGCDPNLEDCTECGNGYTPLVISGLAFSATGTILGTIGKSIGVFNIFSGSFSGGRADTPSLGFPGRVDQTSSRPIGLGLRGSF
ncbi:MAG: hypothetical protein CMH54_09805 [Myxococcales bacterium]|nr:hypothetical protein [Myxococcales bacterium]